MRFWLVAIIELTLKIVHGFSERNNLKIFFYYTEKQGRGQYNAI